MSKSLCSKLPHIDKFQIQFPHIRKLKLPHRASERTLAGEHFLPKSYRKISAMDTRNYHIALW